MGPSRIRRSRGIAPAFAQLAATIATMSSLSTSASGQSAAAVGTIALEPRQFGLGFGTITNTDKCYAALSDAADDDNLVDRDGYVSFVNELSGNAYTSFGRNPDDPNEWGMYPVTEFDDLPTALIGQFYKHACGGEYVICSNAYLYADGTDAGSSSEATGQQVKYLFQVCTGVEKAIEETKPTPPTPPIVATPNPTPTPSGDGAATTASPTTMVEMPLTLTYHAAMPGEITFESLQDVASPDRRALLGAMNKWILGKSKDYATDTTDAPTAERKRRVDRKEKGEGDSDVGPLRRRRATTISFGGRRLVVRPKNMVEVGDTQWMDIEQVDCPADQPDTTDDGAHCISVTTDLKIIFTNEPTGSEEAALEYFEAAFDSDVESGAFQDLVVPADTVRAIYAAEPDIEELPNGSPSPDANNVETVPPPPILPEESGVNAGGIAAGVIVSVFVVGAALFVYRRRDRYFGDDDASSKDSSFMNSHRKRNVGEGDFDPARDLEGGERRSSRDEFSSGESDSSGSMQSFSGSESSSGSSSSGSSYTSASRSSSYLSGSQTTRSSVSSRGKAMNVESDHSSDDPYEAGGMAVTRAAALGGAGKDDGSMTSGSGIYASSGDGHSSGSDIYNSPGRRTPDLMPTDTSKGTTTGDESSAGSSGWDSSDGDSSADSGSVETFDPKDLAKSLGSSVTSASEEKSDNSPELGNSAEQGTIYTTSSSSHIMTSSSSGGNGSGSSADSTRSPTSAGQNPINPAVNPVVQRSVQMLPISEEDEVTMVSSEQSSESSNTGSRRDRTPVSSDIQDAIEKGDWAAVGATAAILADANSSTAEDNKESSSRSGMDMGSIMSDLMSDGNDEIDDARAAEIDQLVETGNWDGVVAVAARYADEADEAASHLTPERPQVDASMTSKASTQSGSRSGGGSGGSVSVETADASSVYSNTTRDSESNTTYSVDTSMEGASTVSGSESGSVSESPVDASQTSSISSSYVSAGGVTSSMISAVSSVDVQEKRQMNAYRAEVEALVRRVVPDEIDNVDDIMVQFSGREEELIETLRSMQEKSIAQRARAAVQKSAKKEAVKSGGSPSGRHQEDDSTTTSGQYTGDASQSVSSYSQQTDSIQRDDEDYSTRSGRSSRSYTSSRSGSSYSSRSGSSEVSGMSRSRGSTREGSSMGVNVKDSSGLSDAIDASDWRAVGEAAAEMQEDSTSRSGRSKNSSASDELDAMIDEGNWTGIVDHASSMTTGEQQSSIGIGSDSDDDLD